MWWIKLKMDEDSYIGPRILSVSCFKRSSTYSKDQQSTFGGEREKKKLDWWQSSCKKSKPLLVLRPTSLSALKYISTNYYQASRETPLFLLFWRVNHCVTKRFSNANASSLDKKSSRCYLLSYILGTIYNNINII